MKYFTITELCASIEAQKRNISNNPTQGVAVNLEALVRNVLDPLRVLYGKPITVNSGYRNPILNKVVGGAATSQHTKGEAVDISAGSKAENRKLFALLETMNFDQLIDEKDMTWIHVSYRTSGNRKQKLKL